MAFEGYGSDVRVTRYRLIKQFGLEILKMDSSFVQELILLSSIEDKVQEEYNKREERKRQSKSNKNPSLR